MSTVEQEPMVALLGAANKSQIKCLQMTDVRGVGGRTVFDDDQLQVRMHAAQLAEQALGRIALTIVFRRSVGFEGRLGRQRKDLPVIRRKFFRRELLGQSPRRRGRWRFLPTEVGGPVEGRPAGTTEV